MNYNDLTDKIRATIHQKRGGTPSRTHRYSTASRISKQLPTHHSLRPKKNPRKAGVVTKDWSQEVKHTSDFSVALEAQRFPQSSPGSDLIPHRIHRWNIKKYSEILAKMKNTIKSKEGMKAKVSVLGSEETKQTSRDHQKQDELWRDLIKAQEERQFQITRITNFFS